MQAANDEEGGGGLVGQRTWGPEWSGPWPSVIFILVFPGWHVANEIAKPQVCINSNNSSIDSQKNCS